MKVTSFKRNYGFYSSSSYLLYKSNADITVLIPADGQISMNQVEKGIDFCITNSSSVLFARSKSINESRGMIFSKVLFYKILNYLNRESILGYCGMGVYLNSELDPIRKIPYAPFQLRLEMPLVLDNYHVMFFEEQPRKAGKTAYGLKGYFKEAIDIISRSYRFSQNE